MWRRENGAFESTGEIRSPWQANLRLWLVVLVTVGVAWRLLRYFLRFPIWGDEAFICLNFVDRGYLDMMRRLNPLQIVPILYLWPEMTVYRWIGDSELAMRLLSLLAGLGSLVLFWKLCKQFLTPLACTLAVGILAVSYFPVRHSCEVKPYAFDLFFALAMLVPAVMWLQQPGRLRYLVFLVAIVPIAMAASYPSVFVAGAISLVLLPQMWREGWKPRMLFVAYNLLMISAFTAHFLVVGRQQIGPVGGAAQVTLTKYWAPSFPPSRAIEWPLWLLDIHTGDLLAYPIGGSSFGSTATTLLCLAGIVLFWRQRRWEVLGLCLAPFALNLVAACVGKYPYGGVTRLCQHLAPGICLMAGTGAAWLLERLGRTPALQVRWTRIAGALLILVAVAGAARDLVKQHKTSDEAWARRVPRDLLDAAGPKVPLVVMNDPGGVKPTLLWYLYRHRERILWQATADWDALANSNEIWCLHYKDLQPERTAEGWQRLTVVPTPEAECRPVTGGPWTLIDRSVDTSDPEQPDFPVDCWEILHWRKADGVKTLPPETDHLTRR
jgi:hypothetical protein